MPKHRKNLNLAIRRKLNFTEGQRRRHPNRLIRIGQMRCERRATFPVTQPTESNCRGFPYTSVLIIERQDQAGIRRHMADLPQRFRSSPPDIRVWVDKQLNKLPGYRLRGP